MVVGRGAPEMVEADLVEHRRRLVARYVPAELGGFLVGFEHHRDRVPAHERAHAPLELLVDRVLGLVLRRDRVDVRRGAGRRRRRTGQLGVADDALEQMLGAVGPVVVHDGVERLQPLTRLLRIDVLLQHGSLFPRAAIRHSQAWRSLPRPCTASSPAGEPANQGELATSAVKRPMSAAEGIRSRPDSTRAPLPRSTGRRRHRQPQPLGQAETRGMRRGWECGCVQRRVQSARNSRWLSQIQLES